MQLIPYLCMNIVCLQYYHHLSTNCQITRCLQSITIQAAVYELDTVWPWNSNPRVYYFQLSTLYQILRDSQWITNQATVCVLNIIWPRNSDPGAYYFQLSTLCQILRVSWWIANQATVSELNTISPRNSNPRAYCSQLSTRYQILRDSQCIASQALVCELDTIWLISYDLGPEPLFNLNHSIHWQIFTPKRNPNRCISSGCVTTTILLEMLNTALLLENPMS